MELLAIVVVVFAAALFIAHQRAKEIQAALKAYRGSLQALKADPANSDLRQKTLSLGRIYSNLVRDKKGNTLFDEVALMNDINAACASTQHAVHGLQLARQPSGTVEDRLSQLQSLHQKGLIDDDDFVRRKREILSGV